jgi:UDP-glucuronate 4-epimerase
MSIHRLCEATVTGASFPRFGDGTQVREFTHVADVVSANLLAADADVVPGTVVNIAGGGEITLNGLISLVADLAGAPVVIEDHPAQAGDAKRNGGGTDRARALLGWAPRVSLRDGLASQLAWHRDRQGVLR